MEASVLRTNQSEEHEMKKTRILLATALVFALSSAAAFAEDKDEQKPENKSVGIDVWAKASTSDALAFDLAMDVGAKYTLPFGLVLGLDSLNFPLVPTAGFGPIGAYEEYDIVFGKTGLDLNVGNSNSFTIPGGFSADGNLYACLGYTYADVYLASVELDPSYLAANTFSFGLGASVGGGWTFDLKGAGSLALWLDGDFDIVSAGAAAFAFTGADFDIDYTYPIGAFKIDAELDPAFTPASADGSAAAFSLPISLKATYSF
jgi:hypothetical protein